MKRSFQSGAARRKEKREKLMREERGKRTLHSFLKGNSGQPESSSNSNCTLTSEGGNPVKKVSNEDSRTNYDNNVNDKIAEVVSVFPQKSSNNDFESTSVHRVNNDLCEGTHEGFKNFISNDPAKWKFLDTKQRELIVLKGPPPIPESLPRDMSGRPFPRGIFFKHQTNGESVKRDWLVWSEEAASLFCFPCTLFKCDDSDDQVQMLKSQLCQGGVNDKWKKLYEKVKSHEGNVCHLRSYIKWKDLCVSLQDMGGIDAALQQNIKQEEEKWRKILKAVVDVVLFLAKRNLPLRGTRSTIDYYDSGLFLATLQLVGRYNVEVGQHLENISNSRESGKRLQAHYLSWRSQNEFLKVCADEVVNSILEEIRSAHYYSIIVDGTPDVSHEEQLVFIIRYVLCQDGEWKVYERFIKMNAFEKKTGAAITDQVKSVLNDFQLDLSLCRGQGYDNASNMSGKFKGVKTRILEENPQAYFTPCCAHTLNLCGTHAMETSIEIRSYFGNVEKLYNIFSASPARWKILQNKAGISLHSTSKTRWSARIESISPLAKNYNNVLSALNGLEDLKLPAEDQADVNGLIEWMSSYEFVIFTTVWYKLLKCIDIRNKILQSSKLCLPEATKHIRGLIVDIQLIRDSWVQLLEESKNVAVELKIDHQLKVTRFRKKKRFHDETGVEVEKYVFKSPEERLQVQVLNPALDILLIQLSDLTERMSHCSRLFSPILTPPFNEEQDHCASTAEDDHPTTSTHYVFSEKQIQEQAEELSTAYPSDLQKDDLNDELSFFYKIREESKFCVSGHISSALELINLIYKKGLESVFPQICTALRLLIVAPVTVASGERAFSKLSLIKNRLRSTTTEDRLNHLMLLSIEHELADRLSFEKVINDFAAMKARKKIV